jgi:hypothetical protein
MTMAQVSRKTSARMCADALIGTDQIDRKIFAWVASMTESGFVFDGHRRRRSGCRTPTGKPVPAICGYWRAAGLEQIS